jgi:hypothetical protein
LIGSTLHTKFLSLLPIKILLRKIWLGCFINKVAAAGWKFSIECHGYVWFLFVVHRQINDGKIKSIAVERLMRV